MKNLRFTRLGMSILLIALCAFGSCSSEELSDEPIEIEYAPGSEDESAADEGTPVTKDPPGGEPPDKKQPVNDEAEDPSLPEEEDSGPNFDEPPEIFAPGEDDSGGNPLTENGTSDPQDTSLPEEEESDENTYDEVHNGIPLVLINELRTEYEKSSGRAEFIELKIMSQGNLDGLKVFIVSNTKNPLVYQFKSVNVNEGEYAVLHLRTLNETSVDEYGDDLSESGGADSSPAARDFWVTGTSEVLRKTDAVYIMDQNDVILDAVIIAEDVIPKESAAFFNQACAFLFSQGAWKSAEGGLPAHGDAVKSSTIGSALTRSISRDETASDSNTAADWYVAATGGVSAGRENDPRRF